MYTICFDTLCTGYEPVMTEAKDKRFKNGYRREPLKYKTEAEAQAEIDSDIEFYGDCFVCPLSDIGHKAIFHGGEHAEASL